MQLPFAAFAPQRAWTPPTPEQWPPFGRAKVRVCIDLENNDEKIEDLGPGCLREEFYIAGVGIAIDGGPRQYIPLRHGGGSNIENEAAFWLWMIEQAEMCEADIVGAHISYDLQWLRRYGVKFPKVKRFYDVLIMDTLKYELHHRGDLDAVCHRLHIPGKDKKILVDSAKLYGLKNPLAEMHKLPANLVVDYNLADLAGPLNAFPLLWKELEAMGCLPLLDVETRLTPILVDMFMRGLKVNTDKLTRMEMWYRSEEQEAINQIKRLTGRQLLLGECGNNNRIGPLLEQQTGVRLPRTGKKQTIKLTENLLAKYEEEHELFKWVHRARKLDTARAFCPQTWEHLVNGRIHCTYNQVRSTKPVLHEDMEMEEDTKGARTGRMSCEHTNLTQQPARDPWAKDWRDIYEADDGMQWGSADFSQQEPRLTTSDAARLNLPKARETSHAYLTNELLDNHAFMATLTGLPRKKAKNIYLGLVYSMGEAKLCRELKLPTRYCVAVGPYRDRKEYFFEEEYQALAFRHTVTEDNVYVFECAGVEGKKMLDTFHARAPFLKQLSDIAKRDGRRHGVIRTILMRHLHLPLKADGSYDEVHACLNKRIQGSAADMMKLAMVNTVEAMPDLWLQLQVHDQQAFGVELGLPGRERAKEIGRIMRNSWKDPWMNYRVDVAVGPSWGREHDMCYDQFCIEPGKSGDEKWCPQHAPA